MSDKLSIIIPFVNEYPQVAFTVQNLYCELRDKADFEIICVDNYCEEVKKQGVQKKKTFEFLKGIEEGIPQFHRTLNNVLEDTGSDCDEGGSFLTERATNKRPWLKVIKYDKKLSHWNAKNEAVKHSTGNVLLFVDAHCIVSAGVLPKMFNYYRLNYERLNGTLHLPLSYLLERPGGELVYQLVLNLDKGIVHYKFLTYSCKGQLVEVPCMSSCGMMMTRKLYDDVGGWPSELGIYGGGENYINFVLAVMGKKKHIFPSNPLFHFAAPRDYHWNHNDWVRNRCIAAFMHSGEQFTLKYALNARGTVSALLNIAQGVVAHPKCIEHRKFLEPKIVMSIEEWSSKWKEHAIPSHE
jgi:glycosyltransferase involved in cell wall biosynthesis